MQKVDDVPKPKKVYVCWNKLGQVEWRFVGSYEAAAAASLHPTTLFMRIRKGNPDRKGRTFDVFYQDL